MSSPVRSTGTVQQQASKPPHSQQNVQNAGSQQEATRASYPPLPSRQDFGPHNCWRRRHQPLAYAWQERTLPWLVHACQQAKACAKEGGERANLALHQWRHERAANDGSVRRNSPVFGWCAGNVHRVGLSQGDWLQTLLAGRQQPEVADADRAQKPQADGWRRAQSDLSDGDWLLPD